MWFIFCSKEASLSKVKSFGTPMTRINEFTRIDKKIVHKELSLDFELDSCYLSIGGIRVQGFICWICPK